MEQEHPYDRLSLVRVMFFLLTIALINIAVLSFFYPFQLQKPFLNQLHHEQQLMKSFFGSGIYGEIIARGDNFYDNIFVETTVEKVVYDSMIPQSSDDTVDGAVRKALGMSGAIIDNLFDYSLLISYRFSIMMIFGSVGLFMLIALIADGLIRRKKKQYGFGDSGVVANIYSRGLMFYFIPFMVIILFLPMSLHPMVLALALTILIAAFGLFFVTLPKKA